MLESVQHRATCLIPSFRCLSYSERLRAMELPSLVYRRFRGDATVVWKYLPGLYSVDSQSFLPLSNSSESVTRGHCLKLRKRSCRMQLKANYFTFRVVNSWDSMPEEVVSAPLVNCFKDALTNIGKTLCTRQMKSCLRPRLGIAGGSIDQSTGHSAYQSRLKMMMMMMNV